jgi:hypothetical protein
MLVESVDNAPVKKDTKRTTLIVVLAFDRDDTGDLVPATEATQWQSEDRARRAARALSEDHVGVVAWSREADPVLGEYGEPVIIAQYGEIPTME